MLIDGARALVCGGASGLGAATARRLHAAGALVTIADVGAERGQALTPHRAVACADLTPL
jgi:NAD(P)-dependent dehydrogenase (short-subunit alcohol dehydrogenase family)